MNTQSPTSIEAVALNSAAYTDKRAYSAPALSYLGDLRDLTLGASPGTGDSGGGAGFKCPGCP